MGTNFAININTLRRAPNILMALMACKWFGGVFSCLCLVSRKKLAHSSDKQAHSTGPGFIGCT